MQFFFGGPMNRRVLASRRLIRGSMILACGLLAGAVFANSQMPVTNDPALYGPFNGVFLPDGDGLKKKLSRDDSVLRADSPWSLSCWVKSAEAQKAPGLVAGV